MHTLKFIVIYYSISIFTFFKSFILYFFIILFFSQIKVLKFLDAKKKIIKIYINYNEYFIFLSN